MPTPSASDLNEARVVGDVDPALVARFRHDLDRLTGAEHGKILIALSGGPDSVALLLLARAALPNGCVAATVDHGLRPAATAEAEWGARLCRGLDVPHTILRGPLPERAGRTANLSARARALRYRLLEDHATATGTHWIATAHHADDQLETLVMRLNRGAGLGGLAGVRHRTGRTIRPLLAWRRAELAALVERAGIAPVDDPSNRDDRFDRARLRKVLAGADWLDPAGFAASARALAEAEDALRWTADGLAAERIAATTGEIVLDPAGLPPALVRRLVAQCLSCINPDANPDGPTLSRLIAALSRGRAGTIGSVVVRPGARWRFRAAPPRRNA